MKRLFVLLLALIMLLGSFPMSVVNVSAEEPVELVEETVLQEKAMTAAPAEAFTSTGVKRYASTDKNYPDNEDLFAGYADSVFFGGSATYNKATGKLQVSDNAMNANAAGKRLSGDTKKVYDAVVPIIKEIAAGKRSSTTVWIGTADADDQIGMDVVANFSQHYSYFDIGLFHDALLSDLPYEQYWYDKTIGVYYDAGYYTSTEKLAYVVLEFTVDQFYRRSTYDDYYTDTAKTSAATTSAANARKIVSANKTKTDYEKLVAYKEAICDRVEYDFYAVNYGDFSVNNNPWQMIYAFDNDPSTNIVCEGYSKAFMYLCDQSDFNGSVTCYTVTGDAGGPHMWNVVTIGGKNYMVDVTNSDSGSIGQNGGLFLSGGSGSPSSGYSFMNGRIYFTYDSDSKNLWGTGSSSILYLSSTDYTPPAELKITTQPKTVSVAIGETAKVSVKATGDGLTYKWYYKNPGATKFSASSTTGSTYSMKMTKAAAGRQVYCLIKDSHGNSVKSKTVTLDQSVSITTQPKSVAAAIGETAKVTVKAAGTGLTYKWYFKNPGKTSYSVSSTTGSSYSMKMTNAAAGRKVYCVVKDKYGNTVKSSVVTLDQEARITTQPKTVCVPQGSTAKVTVKAVGAGLTYKWYFKNAGALKYSLSSKCTGSSYTATMSDAVAGRKVYCVVKDKYGNTVKSSVVTIDQDVRIATQPKSVSVALGKTAKVTVKAVGTGLTYKWYYKNPGATKYTLSSTTGSSYSMKMTQGAAGRKVYCVVIDKYGNTAKTNVVTLNRK